MFRDIIVWYDNNPCSQTEKEIENKGEVGKGKSSGESQTNLNQMIFQAHKNFEII